MVVDKEPHKSKATPKKCHPELIKIVTARIETTRSGSRIQASLYSLSTIAFGWPYRASGTAKLGNTMYEHHGT